eukprot:8614218-Alexandrium_andersonii.AAC.1
MPRPQIRTGLSKDKRRSEPGHSKRRGPPLGVRGLSTPHRGPLRSKTGAAPPPVHPSLHGAGAPWA